MVWPGAGTCQGAGPKQTPALPGVRVRRPCSGIHNIGVAIGNASEQLARLDPTLMEIIGLSLQVRLSAVLLGAISDCRWAQRW